MVVRMPHRDVMMRRCRSTSLTCSRRPESPNRTSGREMGATSAARGHLPQGAPVSIPKSDWCAAAQPTIENQVCGDFGDWEDSRQATIEVRSDMREPGPMV
jgi:hypothetical protein